jgi:hypothetical protein
MRVIFLSLVSLLSTEALAGGTMGVDWVPFDRSDLVWVDSDQDSGTLVGEFDGMVRPALTAYGGYLGDRSAILLGLGAARVSSVTWDGEGYQRVSAGALRPSLDWQLYMRERAVGRPSPWVGIGAWYTIAQANDTADVYTDEEQADADEGAKALRGRIGGVGGRLGVGGDYRLSEGLTLGLRYHLTAHRGQVSSEDSLDVSWLNWGEAAVRLQLEF